MTIQDKKQLKRLIRRANKWIRDIETDGFDVNDLDIDSYPTRTYEGEAYSLLSSFINIYKKI